MSTNRDTARTMCTVIQSPTLAVAMIDIIEQALDGKDTAVGSLTAELSTWKHREEMSTGLYAAAEKARIEERTARAADGEECEAAVKQLTEENAALKRECDQREADIAGLTAVYLQRAEKAESEAATWKREADACAGAAERLRERAEGAEADAAAMRTAGTKLSKRLIDAERWINFDGPNGSDLCLCFDEWDPSDPVPPKPVKHDSACESVPRCPLRLAFTDRRPRRRRSAERQRWRMSKKPKKRHAPTERPNPTPQWSCGHCGTDNHSFDKMCWNCGGDR